jgi:hypothetical protein
LSMLSRHFASFLAFWTLSPRFERGIGQAAQHQ